MTKKILFGMMAATMMFATSCENELVLGTNAGENAQVTFSVGTPEIATRAYSDGQTATALQYAVYDAAGNELTDLRVTDAEIHGSTTVNLQLTTGNTYSVIFWAAAEDAPYAVNFDEKTMTVSYDGAKSNDETRDAFYKHHTFTVKGAQTETIELKRPFAQLNIGTADYAASTSTGYTPVNSAVTVKSIYKTLNLWDGEVSGETEVTYDYAAIAKNEAFPVAGYEYLAMNYLLVAADKALVDVEFAYTETDANAAKTRTVGSVPVQRNYRTNIYGQLLTSDVDINVEIKPEYDEPSHEADALLLAAAVGGEVTLTEDVVLSEPLNVTAGMVLNMDGKKLTGSINVAEGVSLTLNNGAIENTDDATSGIVSNGNLTLNNVEIASARHALRIESGNVVINGGTYKVVPTSAMTLYALNVGDDNTEANVIIKGGTFIGPDGTIADSGGAVAVKAGSKVTIEGGDFSGGKLNTLSSKGDLVVVAGTFDQDPTAYVASGYTVINKDDKYVVSKSVANVEELYNALNEETSVTLTSKIDNGTNAFNVTNNDVVINMENQEVVAGGNNTSNYAFHLYGSNVEVNDANIKGAGFAVMQESSVTVNSGAIEATPGRSGRNMFYVINNSTVTVNEGNYTFDRTSCYFVYVDEGSTCYINGGHFEKPLANDASKDSFVNNGSKGTVVITGGTFNVDPTEWVADGYEATKSGNIWTVAAK